MAEDAKIYIQLNSSKAQFSHRHHLHFLPPHLFRLQRTLQSDTSTKYSIKMSFFKKLFNKDKESPYGPSSTSGPSASNSAGTGDLAKGVVLTTTLGDITIQFYPEAAPKVASYTSRLFTLPFLPFSVLPA